MINKKPKVMAANFGHEILQRLPDIVYVIDRQGRFQYLNPAVAILGYRPAELIGRHFWQIIHPDDRKKISRKFILASMKGLKTGPERTPKLFDERRTGLRSSRNLEVRLISRPTKLSVSRNRVKADGKVIWGSIDAVGYYAANIPKGMTNFQGSIGIIRNITEYKAIKETIQSKDQEYRQLVANINDGLMKVDHHDRILFVNDNMCRMSGYKREELIGAVGYRLLFDLPQQKIIKEKNLLRQKKIADKYEILMKRKDGTRLWVQISGSPFYDEQGQIIGSIGIFTDISQKKSDEIKLHFQADMIQHVHDAIITTDAQLHIQTWNSAAQRLTGYRAIDVIGKSLDQVTGIAALNRHAGEYFKKLFQTGFWHGKIMQKHCQNKLIITDVSLNLVKSCDLGYAGVVAIMRDITSQVLMENELKRRLQIEEAITKISQQIMQTNQINRVIPLVLHQLASIFKSDYIYFLERLPDKNILNATYEWYRPGLFSLKKFLQGLTKQNHPWGIKKLKSHKIINCLTKDLPEISHSRSFYKHWKIKSIFILPIFYKGHLFGTMDIFSRRSRLIVRREDIFFLRTISEMMAIGLLRQQIQDHLNFALKELKNEKKKFLELSRQAINSQEKERFYLASQIHDDLLQDLASLLYALRRPDGSRPGQNMVSSKHTDLIAMVRSLIDRGRFLIQRIEPLYDPDITLIQGIKKSFAMRFADTQIKLVFNYPEQMPKLPFMMKVNILRIIQESFMNIYKHSQASKVILNLSMLKDRLEIVIKDNGVGFSTRQLNHRRSGNFGLLAMQGRAQLVGGHMIINSRIGQGTEVKLTIPLNAQSA